MHVVDVGIQFIRLFRPLVVRPRQKCCFLPRAFSALTRDKVYGNVLASRRKGYIWRVEGAKLNNTLRRLRECASQREKGYIRRIEDAKLNNTKRLISKFLEDTRYTPVACLGRRLLSTGEIAAEVLFASFRCRATFEAIAVL